MRWVDRGHPRRPLLPPPPLVVEAALAPHAEGVFSLGRDVGVQIVRNGPPDGIGARYAVALAHLGEAPHPVVREVYDSTHGIRCRCVMTMT